MAGSVAGRRFSSVARALQVMAMAEIRVTRGIALT